jgi:DNA helicase HerA-like ATPase
MSLFSFSSHHIDYLTRSGFTPQPLQADTPCTSATPALRRLWHITGIGRLEKSPMPTPEFSLPVYSQDLLMGLYGYKIPLAFLVQGTRAGILVSLGTWSPEDEGATVDTLSGRQEILRTVLESLYPLVRTVHTEPFTPRLPLAGLALGIPTPKPPDILDGALPIDRLIRSMSDAQWACLVLAQPLDEGFIRDLRLKVINEIRSVESEAMAANAPSPLAQYYLKLLDPVLMNLTYGESLGAWRTGVYLLGDNISYYRLASAWKGIFSGQWSLSERVHVWETPHAVHLAANWSLPDVIASEGPGHFKHAFDFQTVLTSDQLATYIHLPQLEVAGFRVDAVPDFDAVPPPVDGRRSIHIGNVLHRSRVTSTPYHIDLDDLTKHAFVTGVTGAGKTNTIFHLLKELASQGIHFLVIEPAKSEYRGLLRDPTIGAGLHIFTLGNERVSPLRMNPFEALPGTPVGIHLDLLRSVFSASFGMWTPLPQILEICLHEIYQDRGWDVTANYNPRMNPETNSQSTYPTLTELIAKVDSVTKELGYAGEVTGNVRAALRTRVNSLRTGGRGRMLDVEHSLPMEALLGRPTVLELEGIGDDNDKAFIMGLILIRLVEYLRGQGQHEGLRHLLVVEEAHRLLANTGGPKREEEADPRGKAVETFANLLAEIRAYGQGILIADQVPVKLAPDVIKNTNLKIAHRIVAQDDRTTLAGAMAMSERQSLALTSLIPDRGEAVVFSEGDDSPIMVKVELTKLGDDQTAVSDEEIHELWSRQLDRDGLALIYRTYPTCNDNCAEPNEGCHSLRQLAEDVVLSDTIDSFLLSLALTDPAEWALEHLEHLFPYIRTAIMPVLPNPKMQSLDMRCLVTHAVHQHLQLRGAQYGWDYEDAANLQSCLLPALVAKTADIEVDPQAQDGLEAFCHDYLHLMRRVGPYYGCEQVCQGTCFYRFAVQRHASQEGMREAFRAKVAEDDEEELEALLEFISDRVLFNSVDNVFRRQARLCYLIQEANTWRDLGWERRRILVNSMTADKANPGQGE